GRQGHRGVLLGHLVGRQLRLQRRVVVMGRRSCPRRLAPGLLLDDKERLDLVPLHRGPPAIGFFGVLSRLRGFFRTRAPPLLTEGQRRAWGCPWCPGGWTPLCHSRRLPPPSQAGGAPDTRRVLYPDNQRGEP